MGTKRGREERGEYATISAFLILVVCMLPLNCKYLPSQKKAQKKKSLPNIDVSTEYEKKLPLGTYQNQERLITLDLSGREMVRSRVSVFIPEITQTETRTITITDVTEELKMKPPLQPGVLDKLETSKETSIEIRVVNQQGELLFETSKKINILPSRDMVWVSSEGDDLSPNVASWVTPENRKVQELVNLAAKYTSFKGMIGYQEVPGMSKEQVTRVQVEAIFQAMVKDVAVQYVSTPVSLSGGAVQRIRLPEDVLNQRSGNCIDLSVTVASALEATGMKPYIILTPNHAFVAIKIWSDAGNYVYLETTAVQSPPQRAVAAGEQAWLQAQQKGDYRVVDIALARDRGIKPMK